MINDLLKNKYDTSELKRALNSFYGVGGYIGGIDVSTRFDDATIKYAMNDILITRDLLMRRHMTIEKVIFNAPATIVLWADGTKTVVKCGEDDTFDPEKGLAMAISKKVLGNKGKYYNEFKRWLPAMMEEPKFRTCANCKHALKSQDGEPCKACVETHGHQFLEKRKNV